MKTNTIYIFILAITLLLMSVSVFWYVRNGIISKTAVVKEYYQKEKQNNSFDFGNTLKKEIEQLAVQEAVIKKTFLEKDKVVDFITRIESTGENLNLKTIVQDIKYGDIETVATGHSLSPILFNVQLEGSFSQIEIFLKEIVQSESVLSINELKIYKTEAGVSEYTARITIKGTILSYE